MGPRSASDTVNPDESVVLSGVSGRFPQTDNMREFAANLYAKKDLLDEKETRWPHTIAEIPRRCGKINNLDKFDREFFGYDRNQCNTMDSQLRILLEHVYEAILDAGVNPESLRGSRTGVFAGVCFSETEARFMFQVCPAKGYGLLGAAKSQISNRVSYFFDFHGPSLITDTACSSSMYALDLARKSIASGECDAAVVTGTNLCLHPFISYQFALLGVLAKDGICRPFDANASGYTRSEAVCALFLQKAKDAKRIYCHLLHTKTNCDGFKSEGITYPSGFMQKQLFTELYDEVSINPADISYIEAHSTGTLVGDPEECDAIDKVFCVNRDHPLLIGSVKSNIGHSEATAGVASMAKCIIAMENDMIPPNINFTTVRTDVPSLVAGRLRVVDNPMPLEGPLIAVNSFGFGGANVHALIRRNDREKINQGIPEDDLPRLVIWSGRTKEAVEIMMKEVSERALDADFIALTHNIHSRPIVGYRYRGYGIFSKHGTENAVLEFVRYERISLETQSLVAIFPGINMNWKQDMQALRQFPLMNNSVEKCCGILRALDYDLFENAHASTDLVQLIVGSTVLQLAYVDVLTTLGISFSGYGGHSIGQFTCAYLDQCLSLKQVVELAYIHGIVFSKYNTEISFNALLELGSKRPAPPLSFDAFVKDKILSRFGVVGGPRNLTCAVIDQLKSRGFIAEHLPFVNFLYSKDSGSELSRLLQESVAVILPKPIQPSTRWFNAGSGTLFSMTTVHDSISIVNLLEKIPDHCLLLEPFVKKTMDPVLRSLNRKSRCVPIEQPCVTPVMNLLSTLGHLFLCQHKIDFLKLYPQVNFPVSRGTPMISPLIRWDHRDSWQVVRYAWVVSRASNILRFKLSLSDQDSLYVVGHCIDGRVLYPATGYLNLVWELLAYLEQLEQLDCSIQFEDVQFIRATPLAKNQSVQLTVMLQKASGRFEILDETTVVVTGYARRLETPPEAFPPNKETTTATILQMRDIYKELRLRGYHYSGLFKSVLEARSDGSSAKIQWKGNWVAFLDCMLQVGMLALDSRSLMVPTAIESVTIHPKYHLSLMIKDDEERDYFVSTNCGIMNEFVCGAIHMSGVRAHVINRRNPPGVPVLESYQFIPYCSKQKLSAEEAIRTCVQLALENMPSMTMNATEVYEGSESILPLFVNAVAYLPLIQPTLTLLSDKELQLPNITVKNEKLMNQSGLHFLICHDHLDNAGFVKDALNSLMPTGFLLVRCGNSPNQIPPQLNKVASFPIDEAETLFLLQQKPNAVRESPVIIQVLSSDTAFSWLQELKNAIKTKPVLLYAQNDPLSGVIGLVNCIKKEPKSHSIRCVLIDDLSAPPFALNEPFYREQLSLDLTVNVYRGGTWGSYRHSLLDTSPKITSVTNHCLANCLIKGDLSTMTWFSGPMDVAPAKGELIRVVYSALNFRDVMIATGRLTSDVMAGDRLEQECLLGYEYSGVSVNGRRVMGVSHTNAMATLVECDPRLTWTFPDHWSLEEAATVPVVYCTVYKALFVCSRVTKGKSILIHAGSGGIGLAAIQVCLRYGLEVFTTVSTNGKKQYILARYPQLKSENVGNSRDVSFEQLIKLRTKGKGVDYVLNSLVEEKLQASIRCLGRNGHFLEIGKYDMAKNSRIAMQLFQKGLTFTAVMIDAVCKGSADEKQVLHDLLTSDIRNGIIRPLSATVYPAMEIEKAFRFLASGKHIGKVLLRIRANETNERTEPIPYVTRVYCNPEYSYVIVGGLGGFGLELADWLVLRGCRKLVLSSSRGITKPYQEYRIRLWNSYGVRTIVSTADVTSLEGCRELLQKSSEFGPVAAVFNLAVQLRDNILENQTPEKFTECLAPKSIATQYLDEASRQLCPQLSFFVVFSSVSCGRGNAGQSNYGMANSIMERIVEQRVATGLPGKAIQWGAIGEVGIVADMAEDKVDMEIGGTLQQRISSCLHELDGLLMSPDPIVGSMVVAEKRLGGGSRDIIETVMNIMSIRDLKSVSIESTLADIGMDSLMAVEIKQVLERDFDLVLSPQELRTLTFSKLQKLADGKKLASESTETGNRVFIGMEMLLRNLGDEEFSEETILQLPSAASEGLPILVIPGLEGVAGNIWRTIAAGLNAPVFIVQTLNTADLHSISIIVDHLMPDLDENIFKNINNYMIVGYSFGTFIAMEIAKRLQKRNMPGQLILLDGAPHFLKKLSVLQMGDNPPDELIQKLLMAAIISTVFPNQPVEKVHSIMEIPSFDGQIEKLVEVGKEKALYSAQYIRKMTKALFNRLKMVFTINIEEEEPLNVPIVLIRPSEASTVDIEEDYGLVNCTTGPVSLKTVAGSHMTMLENQILIEVINSLIV